MTLQLNFLFLLMILSFFMGLFWIWFDEYVEDEDEEKGRR